MISTPLARILSWSADYVGHYGVVGLVALFVHQAKAILLPRDALFTVSSPHSGRMTVRARTSDLRVFRQIVVAGGYGLSDLRQRQLDEYYRAIIGAGKTPVIIDGGANIGAFSRLCAFRYPQSRIICVEPEPSNMEICRLNCVRFSNVTLVSKVLWSKNGSVGLKNPGGAKWAFYFSEDASKSGHADQFLTTTVDEICDSIDDGVLMILKMDIEGGEIEALSGNLRFWKDLPRIFIEPHDDYEGHARTLENILKRKEYQSSSIFIRGENIMFFPDLSK